VSRQLDRPVVLGPVGITQSDAEELALVDHLQFVGRVLQLDHQRSTFGFQFIEPTAQVPSAPSYLAGLRFLDTVQFGLQLEVFGLNADQLFLHFDEPVGAEVA
jgi:hypothetical protein